MLRRSFSAVFLVLFFGSLVSARLEAQGSAKDLIAELKSGDSIRCMNAGNSTSEHQEHYQTLASELAVPLFDILENGPCSGSALTALVNVGDGVADGIDAGRAVGTLVAIIEKGLTDAYEAAFEASSAILVVGNFGAAAAPAIPVLTRWILERTDSHDRRYALTALAEIGDASAPAVADILPLLAAPAEDDDDAYEKNAVRAAVAETLGSIPSAVAVSGPVLVAGLTDADYSFRYAARESITKIGAPIIPYLLPALQTFDAEGKATALEVLSGMGAGAAAAAPAIASMLTDADWNVSYQAGTALREIGPTKDGIAAIGKVLTQEEKEDAVILAAGILGDYGSAAKSELPALRKAAASRNWSIANSAKMAIEAIEEGE